jgi:hypothetical protein
MFYISLLLFCCMLMCFSKVCVMLTILSIGTLTYMLDISKEHIRVPSFMFKLRKSVVRRNIFVIL